MTESLKKLAQTLEAFNRAVEAAKVARVAAYREADDRYYKATHAVKDAVAAEVRRIEKDID
jgi:hypothetical protein